MECKVTIHLIDNGYLVEYGGNKFRSYQGDSENNQIALMLTQILKHLGEKGYRVVTDYEAARMAVRTNS